MTPLGRNLSSAATQDDDRRFPRRPHVGRAPRHQNQGSRQGDDCARSFLREQRIACNVGDQHDFFEAFAAPRRSLRRVLHWAVRSTRRRGEERLLQRSSSKSVPTMPQKELASSSRCDLSGNRKRSLFRQAVGGETPTFTTSERKTGLTCPMRHSGWSATSAGGSGWRVRSRAKTGGLTWGDLELHRPLRRAPQAHESAELDAPMG